MGRRSASIVLIRCWRRRHSRRKTRLMSHAIARDGATGLRHWTARRHTASGRPQSGTPGGSSPSAPSHLSCRVPQSSRDDRCSIRPAPERRRKGTFSAMDMFMQVGHGRRGHRASTKRSQADWRLIPRASPILAQDAPRRRVSTTHCSNASSTCCRDVAISGSRASIASSVMVDHRGRSGSEVRLARCSLPRICTHSSTQAPQM